MLTASANSVDEGASVDVSLTDGMANTDYAYTITGVDAADIDLPLTGTFTTDANGAFTGTINALADLTTEGLETMTISIDGTDLSVDVDINDTSLTPEFAISADAPAFDEGSTATFSIVGGAPNTTLSYDISGVDASDIEGGMLTGSVTTDADGNATISVVLAEDRTTEGEDTLTVSLPNTTLSASTIVNDTSLDNNPPQLSDGIIPPFNFDEDQTFTLTSANLLENYEDLDGDMLMIASEVVSDNATVVDNGDGTYTITPDQDFNGSLAFSFDVTDGFDTIPGAYFVDVNPVNDAPVITADATLATDEDTAATFSASATDVEDGAIAVTAEAANGEVVDNGDGTFTYTGDQDFNGTDTITLTSTDADGATTTQDVAVTVAAVDDFTITANSSVNEGEPNTFTVTLAEPATAPVTITAVLSNGTTTNDDFAQGSFNTNVLEFAVGETSKTFDITALNDGITELEETYTVTATSTSFGDETQSVTVTVRDGGNPNVGQTFTLTAGVDQDPEFTGTVADDTYTSRLVLDGEGAPINTLSSLDEFDAAGGTDTLNVELVGNATGFALSNLEVINLENRSAAGGEAAAAVDLDMSLSSGVTQLWNDGNKGDAGVSFSGVSDDATIGLRMATSTTTANFTSTDGSVAIAAMGSGEAPSAEGATDNNSGGAADVILDSAGDDITAVSVSATGDMSRLDIGIDGEGGAQAVDTLMLSGSADLFVNMSNGAEVDLTTVTSTSTGNVILVNGGVAADAEDNALATTYTFGGGNDRLVVSAGNLDGEDSINLGEGMDELEVHFSGEVDSGTNAADLSSADAEGSNNDIVAAVNAGTGIETFIVDVWTGDDPAVVDIDGEAADVEAAAAFVAVDVDASFFTGVNDFIFDDTHDGEANVQGQIHGAVNVAGVEDDDTFTIRATVGSFDTNAAGGETALQQYATSFSANLDAEDNPTATDLNLTTMDDLIATSDLINNNVTVMDTDGMFTGDFTLAAADVGDAEADPVVAPVQAVLTLDGSVDDSDGETTDYASITVGAAGEGETDTGNISVDASMLTTSAAIAIDAEAEGATHDTSMMNMFMGAEGSSGVAFVGTDQDDVMAGNELANSFTGGMGQDVFVASTTASEGGFVAADADVVQDFTVDEDFITFDLGAEGSVVAGTAANYVEGSLGGFGNFAGALTQATSDVVDNGFAFSAQQVGLDVFVFAGSEAEGVTDVVQLVGLSLADLDDTGAYILEAFVA